MLRGPFGSEAHKSHTWGPCSDSFTESHGRPPPLTGSRSRKDPVEILSWVQVAPVLGPYKWAGLMPIVLEILMRGKDAMWRL